MAVAGFHAAYPALPLAEVATAEGQAAIGQIASQCLDEILRTYHGKDPAAYLKGAAAAPGWSEALERNDPGHAATSVPIFIYHGDQDTTVPPAVSAAVASSYCGLGVTVDRKVYPGTDHISVIPAALGDIFGYAARPPRRQAGALHLLSPAVSSEAGSRAAGRRPRRRSPGPRPARRAARRRARLSRSTRQYDSTSLVQCF